MILSHGKIVLNRSRTSISTHHIWIHQQQLENHGDSPASTISNLTKAWFPGPAWSSSSVAVRLLAGSYWLKFSRLTGKKHWKKRLADNWNMSNCVNCTIRKTKKKHTKTVSRCSRYPLRNCTLLAFFLSDHFCTIHCLLNKPHPKKHTNRQALKRQKIDQIWVAVMTSTSLYNICAMQNMVQIWFQIYFQHFERCCMCSSSMLQHVATGSWIVHSVVLQSPGERHPGVCNFLTTLQVSFILNCFCWGTKTLDSCDGKQILANIFDEEYWVLVSTVDNWTHGTSGLFVSHPAEHFKNIDQSGCPELDMQNRHRLGRKKNGGLWKPKNMKQLEQIQH